MSIAIYCEATPLPNVVGRVDYISNPKRQEHLLATASTVDDPRFWRQLAADSQAAWRAAGGPSTGPKKQKNKETGRVEVVNAERSCIEGREVMVQLPNSLLERDDLNPVAKEIAGWFKENYGAECSVAIHLNKKETSVHCHIVFSERLRLLEPEIKVADRNAFLDENGVRKRTKKEILDADGRLRPGCRIVQKGDVLRERYFGAKDPVFKEKLWLHGFKCRMAEWINETLQPDELREVFDPSGPYLPQKKIGKGRDPEVAKEMEDYNRQVKAFNAGVRAGKIPIDMAYRIKNQVMLSPNRLQALKAAWHMETKNTIAMTEQLQGGIRTNTGPDEGKKRELREMHRKAAAARRAAAQTSGLDRTTHLAEARWCSSRIEKLRRELGYYKDEDYERRLEAIRLELLRKQDWLLRCRCRVAKKESRVDYLLNRVKYLERQLYSMPMFMLSPKEKAQREQLEAALTEARGDLAGARFQEAQARLQYRQEKQKAKEMRKALKQERRELQKEQKQGQKKTSWDDDGER